MNVELQTTFTEPEVLNKSPESCVKLSSMLIM